MAPLADRQGRGAERANPDERPISGEELAGVRLVMATDPLTTASRLATQLGADLARTPIEAELALERRQRTQSAVALAAAAEEAFALARDLADTDEEADRALIEDAAALRADAARTDTTPTRARLQHAIDDVSRAEANLAAAEEERRHASDARERANALGAQRVDGIDAEAARALASDIRDAAAVAQAAQRALGRRPTLAAEDLEAIDQACQRLRRTDERVASIGRRSVRLLIQAAGVGLILAALTIEREAATPAVVAALAAPLVLAALWSLRSARATRARLREARRDGAALVARVFPELVSTATDGSMPVDPLAEWERRVAAWEENAKLTAAAENRLLRLQHDWRTLADISPEELEQLLAARRDLVGAEGRLAETAAAVDRARQRRAMALQRWQQALAAADIAPHRPDELDAVLQELGQRDARRERALERLRGLPAAEQRMEARRRLAAILAGRTVQGLAATADMARLAARPESLRRPLILADPLAALPHTRWAALRRQLAELDGSPCVLVTAEPEAATWGIPPLD